MRRYVKDSDHIAYLSHPHPQMMPVGGMGGMGSMQPQQAPRPAPGMMMGGPGFGGPMPMQMAPRPMGMGPMGPMGSMGGAPVRRSVVDGHHHDWLA